MGAARAAGVHPVALWGVEIGAGCYFLVFFSFSLEVFPGGASVGVLSVAGEPHVNDATIFLLPMLFSTVPEHVLFQVSSVPGGRLTLTEQEFAPVQV